jgi:beta-galactosidase
MHRKTGETLDLANEFPIHSGELTAGGGWKTISFDKTTEARYICLEALSSQNNNDQTTTLAELEVTDESGNSLPRSKWKVIYADSEEVISENNSATRACDNQESTFWSTKYSSAKPTQPHMIVIDMGETMRIEGFRCLPRTDNSENGMIKAYKFYAKTSPFKF